VGDAGALMGWLSRHFAGAHARKAFHSLQRFMNALIMIYHFLFSAK
jgi:hypothetical protein